MFHLLGQPTKVVIELSRANFSYLLGIDLPCLQTRPQTMKGRPHTRSCPGSWRQSTRRLARLYKEHGAAKEAATRDIPRPGRLLQRTSTCRGC